MKNLKKISATLLIAIITFTSFAQGPQKSDQEKAAMREKMDALKVAYITDKLDLSEKEAKAFWPIYNQNIEDKKGLKSNFSKPDQKREELSDAALEKKINEKFANEQKKLDLDIAYTNKLKSVIGIQKVAKLYKAEHSFKKEMFDKLKKDGEHSTNCEHQKR